MTNTTSTSSQPRASISARFIGNGGVGRAGEAGAAFSGIAGRWITGSWNESELDGVVADMRRMA